MTESIPVMDGGWADDGLHEAASAWGQAPTGGQDWSFAADVAGAFAGWNDTLLDEDSAGAARVDADWDRPHRAGPAPDLDEHEEDDEDDGVTGGPADFRSAAVRLARAKPRSNTALAAAREAAQALQDLAEARNEAALRQYLRPDPEKAEVTWTVACYQIGDLTPCTLKDFASAVAALRNLVDCGQTSHLAAELVASTPSGTRWTALIRTADQVNFQLPSEQSAANGADGGSSLAAAHWRRQLARWQAGQGDDLEAGGGEATKTAPGKRAPAKGGTGKAASPKEASAKAATAKGTTSKASVPAPASPQARASRPPRAKKSPPRPMAALAPASNDLELERALEMVVATLHRVEVNARRAEHPDAVVLRRLDDLDRRMSEFEVAFEAALDRRIHALARYTAELTRALTAQQHALNAHMEARLDEVLAYLPRPLGPAAEEPADDEPASDS